MSTFVNVFRQALRPARLKVMAKKVVRRLESNDIDENIRWLNSNAVSFESSIACNFPELWQEACEAATAIDEMAKVRLSALPVQLGGGGATPYLYFLARLLQPDVVVETGVAAGYSSQAFLQAMDRNGRGMLFSSDFPYFRIANPEKYIGCVVEERLKARWRLFIEGDEANLRSILGEVSSVDIFHYDSDKSYAGRSLAMSVVKPRLQKHSIVLMDDIQDNSYFRDLVRGEPKSRWKVFSYRGKFVGLVADESLFGNLK